MSRRLGYRILDNAFHVVWYACAMVGVFVVSWQFEDGADLQRLRGPIILGLVMGTLTAPAIVRRIRPRLARRFPWAFRA